MRICFPNQRGKNLIFQRLEGNELCWVVVAVGWHREGVALPGLHHSTVGRVSFSLCSPIFGDSVHRARPEALLGILGRAPPKLLLEPPAPLQPRIPQAAVSMPAPQTPSLRLTFLIQRVFEEEKPHFPTKFPVFLPIRGRAAAAPGRAPLRPVWPTANCFLMADSV